MQPRIWKDVKLAAMRRAQLLVSVFVNPWHIKINLCFGRTLITNFFSLDSIIIHHHHHHHMRNV